MQTQQSQQVLQNECQYTRDRAREAELIEAQLNEISRIIGKVAAMIHGQRESIITIKENVEDATLNVDRANDELLKFLLSLKGNQSLLIKVFALLIFLAIIFTVFIA